MRVSAIRTSALFLVFTLAGHAPAQQATAPPAAQPAPVPELPVLNPDGPDLVAESNSPKGPKVRFPVAHGHPSGNCYGYLFFTRDTIGYEALAPNKDKWHSFEWSRKDLRKAEQWRMGVNLLGMISIKPVATSAVELKFDAALYHFTRLSRADMLAGRVNENNPNGINELLEAVNSFEGLASRLQAQLDRTKPPPIEAPVVTVSQPTAVGPGGSLTVGRLGPIALAGIAQHSSGIAWVHVNNSVANLRPLSPQMVEFTLDDLRSAGSAGRVAIIVHAMSGQEVQLNFALQYPRVTIAEPAPGSSVTDDAILVHGTVAGLANAVGVNVAGVKAKVIQRADGSLEFVANGVPIAAGTTGLTGEVVTADGRQSFPIDVQHPKPQGPPPLQLTEVEDLLKNGVPAARVTALVKQYGASFRLDDGAEKRLRAVGADSDLLLAIALNKK